MVDREQTRDELLAVLAATRELEPEDDAHLADGFLDRLDHLPDSDYSDSLDEVEHSDNGARRVEFAATLLGSAVGLGSVAYVVEAFQATPSLAVPTMPFTTASAAFHAALPSVEGISILCLLMLAGGGLHSLWNVRTGLLLLGASALVLDVSAAVAMLKDGPHFSLLFYVRVLNPSALSLLYALVVVLSTLAVVTGIVRPNLNRSRVRRSPRRGSRLRALSLASASEAGETRVTLAVPTLARIVGRRR